MHSLKKQVASTATPVATTIASALQAVPNDLFMNSSRCVRCVRRSVFVQYGRCSLQAAWRTLTLVLRMCKFRLPTKALPRLIRALGARWLEGFASGTTEAAPPRSFPGVAVLRPPGPQAPRPPGPQAPRPPGPQAPRPPGPQAPRAPRPPGPQAPRPYYSLIAFGFARRPSGDIFPWRPSASPILLI